MLIPVCSKGVRHPGPIAPDASIASGHVSEMQVSKGKVARPGWTTTLVGLLEVSKVLLGCAKWLFKIVLSMFLASLSLLLIPGVKC